MTLFEQFLWFQMALWMLDALGIRSLVARSRAESSAGRADPVDPISFVMAPLVRPSHPVLAASLGQFLGVALRIPFHVLPGGFR